jgi:hypothetical protein
LEFEGMTNWLTPETAIGCRLPCGAVVVRAANAGTNCVRIGFDRTPKNGMGDKGSYSFCLNGSHYYGTLPNLIPPTPAQAGVFVTREALRNAMGAQIAEWNADGVAQALGIPPDPPKVAPWEKAFADWHSDGHEERICKQAWKAAVEWCVGQVEAEYGRSTAVHHRIMGDQA